MTPHIPEEFSTRLIDWTPFVIMGNPMPQGLGIASGAFGGRKCSRISPIVT